MDGNRTHPGRLNSAPQTVLKTAVLACTAVRRRPGQFEQVPQESTVVRARARQSQSWLSAWLSKLSNSERARCSLPDIA